MTKRILIIYPHWPPSNLAGTHRARLIANFAHEFDWEVNLLTIDSCFYEEALDDDMNFLVNSEIKVYKTDAFPVIQLLGKRLLGDIGIRGLWQLRTKMLKLLKTQDISFVWIPIPSWYTSLLGRIALRRCRVRYGIDYIDPWVYQLTDHEPRWSRAWWTRFIATKLEPFAIRQASLISGVSQEYYLPALSRVFKSQANYPFHVAMPYGFDLNDHETEPSFYEPPWGNNDEPYLIYAGAYLPQSEVFMASLFSVISAMSGRNDWPKKLKVRFVGTGKRPGVSISELAEQYNISHIVQEYPERIPFLQVQKMLRESFGNLIIGSTEAHYTASKTFQCILSKKPVFAIFHQESSAATFLREANCHNYLVKWNNEMEDDDFKLEILDKLSQLIQMANTNWNPTFGALEQFSARASARTLFTAIEKVSIQP